MNAAGVVASSGALGIIRIPRNGFYEHGLPEGIPLRWRLRSYWLELALRVRLAFMGIVRGVQGLSCGPVARLHLSVLRADGTVEHRGLVGTKVVTDAGVAYLVDDWDGGANTVDLWNYHGCGTGTTAEAAGDTALVTESTTALDPDSTRATGTKSQPAANQMRTVGTVSFDAAGPTAITEHGVFTQAATGGGTLLDRTVFAAVNVYSGDSIQFTYTCTWPSGS